MTEETVTNRRLTMDEVMALSDYDRDEYHETRRKERWAFVQEIEARVPGLSFGDPSEGGWPVCGGMCPWQAEGMIGDRPFYARYRSNTAAMTIYDRPPSFDGSGREKEIESAVIYPFRTPESEHTYDGVITTADEMVDLFERLIPLLAPVSEENPSHRMILTAHVKAMVEAMDARKASETD